MARLPKKRGKNFVDFQALMRCRVCKKASLSRLEKKYWGDIEDREVLECLTCDSIYYEGKLVLDWRKKYPSEPDDIRLPE